MSVVTDKLKNTKIFVPTNAKAVEVQELLFSLGFKWGNGDRTPIRNLFATEALAGGYPMMDTDKPGAYLCVDHNCRISWYPAAYKPTVHKHQIVMSQLREIVEAHKLQKRLNKKAQRAKKNPWIANTGVCPVKAGELVDIKFRDGDIEYAIKALVPDMHSSQRFTAEDWRLTYVNADITHYRIVKPQPVKVRTTKPDKKVSVGQLIDAFKAGKPVDVVVGPDTSPKLEGTTYSFDTNPKKQFGDKSIPLNLWPAIASAYGAIALYNGKLKYGANNFAATKVEASVYISAAKRHLEAWACGEELDPADGVPNLAGVLANIAILLVSRSEGTMIDDRNLGTGYLKERDALKGIVGNLQVLHEGKTPTHYYRTEV